MSRATDGPHRPTFTIIVPTHNESADIGATCDALLALAPAADEIIFVDDASSDDTRSVIGRYLVCPSMYLIEEPTNRGVAATRNVGARVATGDIIVFLNADVRLPSDFLLRLAPHYQHGADYVAVESSVINTDCVYGRFLQAQHQHLHGATPQLGWTEGFSCRRPLALQAGLFADALPGAGGEDGEFVQLSAGRSSPPSRRAITTSKCGATVSKRGASRTSTTACTARVR
jgi:glycosyltransferase involved in cell wall biosynthesis